MKMFSYFLTPFIAWIFAGLLKFLINSIRVKQCAFKLIGYGGFPSNHTAIVTSMAAFIAFEDGIQNAAFGTAVTLAFIVILDASALRKQIGKQAKAINQLSSSTQLRERMGHTCAEIVGGICVGIFVAWTIWILQ